MTTRQRLTNVYKERRPAGHWFDPKTISFFGTRFGRMTSVGNVYLFVTSERPPQRERAYSVRRMNESGDISTVGPFCEMTRAQANRAFVDAVLKEA